MYILYMVALNKMQKYKWWHSLQFCIPFPHFFFYKHHHDNHKSFVCYYSPSLKISDRYRMWIITSSAIYHKSSTKCITKRRRENVPKFAPHKIDAIEYVEIFFEWLSQCSGARTLPIYIYNVYLVQLYVCGVSVWWLKMSVVYF